jgi:hypothetical protein
MIRQFKVTLKGIEPPVWRRLLVEPTMAMEELHYVIQTAMNWDAQGEYQFSAGKRRIIDTDAEGDEDDEFASDILIGQVFRKPTDKWLYTYDYDDQWETEILLEEIIDLEHGVEYPLCVDGERTAPPEGAGGAASYLNMLGILKNPKDPQHREVREWLGEGYDPDAFDKDAVNEELHDPDSWIEDDED